MEELPIFKTKEDKDKFFNAVKYVENEGGINPQEKYMVGSIQDTYKGATNGGEYQPYVDTLIKKTKDRLLELYSRMEGDRQATHTLSKEHFMTAEERQKEKTLLEEK